MDALEPLAVQHARRVADDQEAVAVRARPRPPAPLGQRLGAVERHLAAVEQLADLQVGLEALELQVRIGQRVLVVQADDQADDHLVVLHAIEEAAAEDVEAQRPAERVDHLAGLDAPRRHVPDLLDADGVDLGVLVLPEVEARVELLDQRAARPLAQHHHLAVDVHPGLVVGLLLAGVRDAAVGGAHAHDPAVLDQRRGGGELVEDVDAHGLDLGRHPLDELAQGGHVVAVVFERRRDGQGERLRLRQVEELLALHLPLEGRALPVVGEQLAQGAGIDHRAGQRVAPHLAALFEHRDGDLHLLGGRLVVLPDQAGQVVGAGEAGGPGSDEKNVDVKRFTLHGPGCYHGRR